MLRVALFLLLAAIGLAARPAAAHPHVWIVATATLIFEGDRVTAIRQEWQFDEIFSGNIIHDFDRNKDGKFDAKETREVEVNAFGNLGQYDFFTRLTAGGAKTKFKTARAFSVERQGKRVVYRFTLDLPEPIEPLKRGIQLAIFDETYFVEILLAEIDPIRFEGARGIACQTNVVRDDSLAAAFGVGLVEAVNLACGSGG
jgi:ABC-type uncharacterized transport system substrate-binding protein